VLDGNFSGSTGSGHAEYLRLSVRPQSADQKRQLNIGDEDMAWTPEQKAQFERLMAIPSLSIDQVFAGLLNLTEGQLKALNRHGDPIAEYGDWTADNEWLPPEEALMMAETKAVN
jgi:hypothetical protein